MNRTAFDRRRKRALLGALCITALLATLMAGNLWAAGAERERMAGRATTEVLTVPFVQGDAGVWTANSYSGVVRVKVRGTGQASGPAYSDAFYIFTDGEGNPIEPFHPDPLFNWTLWINGGPADLYVNPIPPYNPEHVYVFDIVAPGGPLNFAVGNSYTADNTGSYKVAVRGMTQ
jgi:hypothetical protein